MALEKLKKTSSLNDLAELLGYKPQSLAFILYKIPSEYKYTEFEIPKKYGGVRKIKAPVERLKKLQCRLASLLTKCYEEISNTSKKSKKRRELAHGFREKYSIVTNAENHTNKRYVFNVDLEDFFPSIHFGRVRGFFMKNDHFKLEEKVATIIAQIACHKNELPQGSPCSPIISNLIGHILDIRLAKLARKTRCTYSRYADDLTFSTNVKEFPKEISQSVNGNGKWIAGKELSKEIERAKFNINDDKTSLQFRFSRQVTTGLVVNRKVNIKREYYKRARTMCYSLFETGSFYIGQHVAKVSAQCDQKATEEKKVINPGKLSQLEGILSHIHHVKSIKVHQEKSVKSQYVNSSKSQQGHDTKPVGLTDFLTVSCFINIFLL